MKPGEDISVGVCGTRAIFVVNTRSRDGQAPRANEHPPSPHGARILCYRAGYFLYNIGETTSFCPLGKYPNIYSSDRERRAFQLMEKARG